MVFVTEIPTTANKQTEQKKEAAKLAASWVEHDMVLGLGTGSTAALFLAELAQRIRDEGLRIIGVPTSDATMRMAVHLGIPLAKDYPVPDIVFDGADECNSHGVLIKGGGGALLREKIVASAAKRMVVMIDDSKNKHVLGKFPLPVEILPWGADYTLNALKNFTHQHTRGAVPVVRQQRSDNGNILVDLPLDYIAHPHEVAQKIHHIAGVVECGLFLEQASTIICGERIIFERGAK